MAKVKFVPFDSLPCQAEIFTINGIEAYLYDFGMSETNNLEEGDEGYEYDLDSWGCRDRIWTRWSDPPLIEETCDKYHINKAEYDEICDMLEEQLSFDECGWCI